MANLFYSLLRHCFDFSAKAIGPKPLQSLEIKDITLNKEIKLRIYKPKSVVNQPLPIVMYYHGGGWVMGSIKAYDRIIRYLCSQTKSIFIAVEYRKAPEYKFPAALDDAIFAYKWMVKNLQSLGGNPNKITIMGDSAGGNITALVQKHIGKIETLQPKIMVLIYPVVEASSKVFREIEEDKNWLLGKYGLGILHFSLIHYLGSLKSENLKKISLLANLKKTKNFSKTLVITAEIDSLTASINQYVKKLKALHMPVVHKHYPDTIHGFINFAGVFKSAKKALDDIAGFLRKNL